MEAREKWARQISREKTFQEALRTISDGMQHRGEGHAGQGCAGSLFFQFSMDFVTYAFLKPSDMEQCKRNLAQPLIASIWNATCLYFTIVTL